MAPDPGAVSRGLRACGRFLLRQPRALAWIAPLGWATTIWVLSARPTAPDLERGAASAFAWNLAHAPVFGLLALLLLPLAPRAGDWVRIGRRELAWLGLLAVGYGVLDEWHQSYVSGRHASWLDVLTDAVGVGCVLWVTGYLSRAGATEAGLRGRLLVGLLACAAIALAATL